MARCSQGPGYLPRPDHFGSSEILQVCLRLKLLRFSSWLCLGNDLERHGQMCLSRLSRLANFFWVSRMKLFLIIDEVPQDPSSAALVGKLRGLVTRLHNVRLCLAGTNSKTASMDGMSQGAASLQRKQDLVGLRGPSLLQGFLDLTCSALVCGKHGI